MTTASLLPVPKARFFDASGAPLAGGLVYTYAAGTTTPKVSYLSSTVSVPNQNANPVVLDAAGQADIWLSGNYKIVLKNSSGVTQWTVDNVLSISDVVISAAMTPVVTASTLALARTALGATTVGNSVFIAASAAAARSAMSAAASGANSDITSLSALTQIPPIIGGGYINKFRNGTFDIWQRGISGTVTSGSTGYSADGWIVGAVGATAIWAQSGMSGILIQRFALAVQGDTSMTDTFIKQRIESSIAAPLLNTRDGATSTVSSVTIQVSIDNNSGATLTPTVTVKYPTAVDNYASTGTYVAAANLQPCTSGTWTTCAYTFTIDGNCTNGLEVTFDFGSALNANTKSVSIACCDIRSNPGATIGLTSVPPVPEMRPIGAELAFCQRYLAAFGGIAGAIGNGAATTTSASGYVIPFTVPMRVAPTSISVTTPGDFEIADYAAADVAATTGLTYSAKTSNLNGFVTAAVAATPLTAAVPYMLYTKTALAGNLLFLGAEL